MSERAELINSIVDLTADYRVADLGKRDPSDVDAWIKQFEKEDQLPMLREVFHVLRHTYFSRVRVEEFLDKLISNQRLAGDDATAFWKGVKFLNIQRGGASQREMLEIFDRTIKRKFKYSIATCGGASNQFVYIDDGLFSGNRVLNDLRDWIKKDAPKSAIVHVVVMASSTNGEYYAITHLRKAAQEAQKEIKTHIWRAIIVEDSRNATDNSDVLRPTKIPDLSLARDYVKKLTDAGYPPLLRRGASIGGNKFFSTPDARELLEQKLLIAGLQIRESSPRLPENARPLGFSVLRTLGFGSLFVTFRNCPNNCPLAFWAGNPWSPLFARKTN